ncbi:MAG: hypothetical protein OXT67_11415 [Zetaproteobacteria bacterium]|nr:hypothetical protein [Zetaproteobacteria bacterium]
MRTYIFRFSLCLLYIFPLYANNQTTEIVSLNVGGHNVQTRLSTLSSAPGSALYTMFAGDFSPGEQTPQGVFIDENIEHIQPILHWLRHRQCTFRDISHAEAVYHVAGVWCDAMQPDICEWARTNGKNSKSKWLQSLSVEEDKRVEPVARFRLKRHAQTYQNRRIEKNFWQLQEHQDTHTETFDYQLPFNLANLYLQHAQRQNSETELVYFGHSESQPNGSLPAKWFVKHFILNLKSKKTFVIRQQRIQDSSLLEKQAQNIGEDILNAQWMEKMQGGYMCVTDASSATSNDRIAGGVQHQYLILDTQTMLPIDAYRFYWPQDCFSYLNEMTYVP